MTNIIITGSSGFIGRNLVNYFSKYKNYNIICVDKKNIKEFKNKKFIQYKLFLREIRKLKNIHIVFHQGANSDTTESNLKKIYKQNYEYSKLLLDICLEKKINFIYASSASIYGTNPINFKEVDSNYNPGNHYAFTKTLFDKYVDYIIKKNLNNSQVTGLRYFNVYGPYEGHKKEMRSVINKFYYQYLKTNKLKLFKGYDGYKNGEQSRDFIHVDDIIKINLFFMKKKISGIFNCGTGRISTFNKVAKLVISNIEKFNKNYKKSIKQDKTIEYIKMPSSLFGKYQNFTKANLKNLKIAGYNNEFLDIDNGIKSYIKFLNKANNIK